MLSELGLEGEEDGKGKVEMKQAEEVGDEIGKCDKHRMPLRKVAFLYFWCIFIVPDNRFHYDILMIPIICIDFIHS